MRHATTIPALASSAFAAAARPASRFCSASVMPIVTA